MKKLTFRLFIALLTFVIGVTFVLAWVFIRMRPQKAIGDPKPSAVSCSESTTTPPVGCKQVEVEGKVILYIPHDMIAGSPLGDSDDYRAVYRNGDLRITIIYGKSDLCDVPQQLTELATYKELVFEVDGAKGKLGIQRDFEPGTSVACFCVPVKSDSTAQLRVNAICKSNRALEIAQEIFASMKFKDK